VGSVLQGSGGGLPPLALTPGTAGRLRGPSRLQDAFSDDDPDEKENTELSLSSPSASPKRMPMHHHNPLSLETPPSSPGLHQPVLALLLPLATMRSFPITRLCIVCTRLKHMPYQYNQGQI
jgi:hypothetical protein